MSGRRCPVSADLASSAASGSVLDPVRALQHTLYRSAKADPGRRFHALRDKVYRRDVLWRAWVAVRRNNGAPGVDGTTLAEVEEYGVDRFLDELAEDLRTDRWRPLPARRGLIPKPGTSEQRPLSIPSVRDRVVAAAGKSVREPIFEAGFLSCSFGFRPKRATHDALQVLIDESWQGKRWVVETDIANCFSAIPSPLLCNVYLHRLDRVWDTSEHGVLVVRKPVVLPDYRDLWPMAVVGSGLPEREQSCAEFFHHRVVNIAERLNEAVASPWAQRDGFVQVYSSVCSEYFRMTAHAPAVDSST